MKPQFSIIIPTYNRAELLQKTVASVLAQTLRDWELIIMDDGSTDDTAAVVKKLQEKDARIVYMHQQNARQAAARNTGLARAKGEWIAYIDSDDVVYPNFLADAAAFIDAHPETIFATANMDRRLQLQKLDGTVLQTVVQPPTQIASEDIRIEDYANWTIKPCGTGIFHKRVEVIGAGIAWDANMRLLEDLDFLLQLGNAFPNGFGYIPTKLFEYTQVFGTDGVCSGANYQEFAHAFEVIYEKFHAFPIMREQTWYPDKVENYKKLQSEFDKGLVGPMYTRYFDID